MSLEWKAVFLMLFLPKFIDRFKTTQSLSKSHHKNWLKNPKIYIETNLTENSQNNLIDQKVGELTLINIKT